MGPVHRARGLPSLSPDMGHFSPSPFLLQGEPGPPGDPGLTVSVRQGWNPRPRPS